MRSDRAIKFCLGLALLCSAPGCLSTHLGRPLPPELAGNDPGKQLE
jgi:hypothetical protein